MNSVLSASRLHFMNIIAYPDIRIEEKKMTFVGGESGCGKSTLLKLFNATLSPSAGTILFHGEDIKGLDTIALRRKVLLASQDVYLFDRTIRENFDAFYGCRDEKPIDDNAIRAVLSLCCADFPLNTQCAVLSGGERQRIFLAVCLSFSPEVLLLDEPTSALDGKTAHQLLAQIKEFCGLHGITTVIVCHDKTLAEAYADRVILLERGAAK